jgi:hypothetical protein
MCRFSDLTEGSLSMSGAMMMRIWTSGVLLILTCWVLPGSASAQAVGDPDGRQQVGCFRGRPLPACKSFWIFEMQGSAPVVQTTRPIQSGGGFTFEQKAFESVLEWNVGHMVNLNSTYAIGGVVTAGTGNDDALTGLKLRVRRWLGSDVSLEAEGGPLWNDAQGGGIGNVGATAALRLNIRDQGSLYLRWGLLPITPQSPFQDYFDPGGTQQGLSVGIGTGSVPALISTGAAGLTLAVFLALLVGQD